MKVLVSMGAARKLSGLAKTRRIAILSNHMADLSKCMGMMGSENARLRITASELRFKVLDRFVLDHKEMVLLLHFPDDENWKQFENANLDVERDLRRSQRDGGFVTF